MVACSCSEHVNLDVGINKWSFAQKTDYHAKLIATQDDCWLQLPWKVMLSLNIVIWCCITTTWFKTKSKEFAQDSNIHLSCFHKKQIVCCNAFRWWHMWGHLCFMWCSVQSFAVFDAQRNQPWTQFHAADLLLHNCHTFEIVTKNLPVDSILHWMTMH